MAYIPPISPLSGSYKPSEGGQVQQIVNEHCRDYPNNIPLGCNVLVMVDGQDPILYQGGKITLNGPINWGSVSKQFTAACVDKLVKQGKIKYTDDIRKLCPDLLEFKLNGVVQKVTVDDLLHMRSGLPEVWGTALMKGQDAEKLDNPVLLRLLKEHPGMVFAPGAKFMYCNTNYYVLAKLVEDISETRFPDFVREQVLVPLKMEARCSIDPSSHSTIPGYELDPKDNLWKDVTSTNKNYGTTGLIGPPSDMAAWNAAIANRDYDLLEPPKTKNPAETNYCRGVVVDYVDDYTVISHSGALSGAIAIYRRYEYKDPRKTFAIFLTTNADDIPAAEATAAKLAHAISKKDLSLPQNQTQTPVKRIATQVEVQPFCGTFRCRELNSHWLIKQEDLKGNWGLCMTPPHNNFPKWIFAPQFNGDQHTLKSDGYGNPSLELTPTGFIAHCDNLAPLHFEKY